MSRLVQAFADLSLQLQAWPLAWWLAKITALLGVAWGANLAFAGTNPRLRVLLWRVCAVGVVAVSVLMWLPPVLTLKVTLSRPKANDNGLSQPEVAAAPIETVRPSHSLGKGTTVAGARPDHAASIDATKASQPTTSSNSAAPRVSQQSPSHANEAPAEVVRPVVAWNSPAGGMSLHGAAIIAWLIVAAAFASRLLMGSIRIRNIVRNSTAVPDWIRREHERLLKRLQLSSSIAVLQSNAVAAPCLAGVRRPVVLLPSRMCVDSRRPDVTAALAHELCHAAANDILWNQVLQAVSLGLWFHPLAAVMRVAHVRACEDACDVAAAELTGGQAVYSRSLARIALEIAAPQTANTLAMARSADVSRRLRLLERTVSSSTIGRPTRVVFVALAVLMTAFLGGFAVSSAETTETSAEAAAAQSDVPAAVPTDAVITPEVLKDSQRRTIRELGDRRFRHANQIRKLAFSPDGKLLATLDLNQPHAVRLWNVATGDQVRSLAPTDAVWRGTQAFAFTPDGTSLVAGEATGQIGVFDMATGEQRSRFKAHGKGVQSIAVSADGRVVVTGGQDGRIRACQIDAPDKDLWLYEIGKGTPDGGSMTVVGAYGAIGLAFTPDGQQVVAAAAYEAAVAVIDAATGKVIREIKNVHGGGTGKGPGGALQTLAVTQDSALIVTGGNRMMRRADVPKELINNSRNVRLAEAKVWDLATGKLTRDLMKDRLELGSGYVAISADGKTVALRQEGKLQFIDLMSGSVNRSIPLNGWSMGSPAFSPDGKLLATVVDNTVALIDVESRKRLFADKPQHQGGVRAVACSRGAEWGEEQLRRDGSLGKLYRYTKPIVATTGSDGTVHFWDAQSGEHLLEEGLGTDSGAWDATFSDDGTRFAASGYSHDAAGAQIGTVAVWSLDVGASRMPLPARGEAVALAPDGGRAVVAYSNGGIGDTRLELWDMRRRRRVAEFPRNADEGLSQYKTMRFSPDGRYVLIAEYDGKVTKWDTSAEAQDVTFVADWRKHVDVEGRVPRDPWLGDAKFTSDGKTLVTSTNENMLIWDVDTGRPTGKIVVPSAKHGFHIAIAPDNRTLVTSESNYANEPGTDLIRLFDIKSRELVLSLQPDGDRATSFAFSPDSTQLTTGFGRGTATVWDIKR
ncbi:MAG: M56 family metallopeptidase [Planctomycetaceae bacterium]